MIFDKIKDELFLNWYNMTRTKLWEVHMKKELELCIIGFGSAARAFCEILLDKTDELEKNYGYEIIVTDIATYTKGCIHKDGGLDLRAVFDCVDNKRRIDSIEGIQSYSCTDTLLSHSEANVMVELSALSIHDGQPSISYIEKAFQKDMHVISANKGPIAWAYHHLKGIAEEKALQFLFETTVMDGTPIFNLHQYALPGTKVMGFKGILNSTTNFVLEAMENGKSYDDAIKEAQVEGFAEADPSMDIDGWDAAAKTAVLATVLMNESVTPHDVVREGISGITLEDIQNAAKKDQKIKLICEGRMENGCVKCSVSPVAVGRDSIFSFMDATSSIVSLTTDLMGEIMIIEKNPEILQTGYGIYSDLLTLIRQ